MSKVIRAISESLSKGIKMSGWACISLDLSRERQKKARENWLKKASLRSNTEKKATEEGMKRRSVMG